MPDADPLSSLADTGVVAVLRAPSTQTCLHAVEALVDGGVRGIEVAYTTPDALAVIGETRRRYGDDILLRAAVFSAAWRDTGNAR